MIWETTPKDKRNWLEKALKENKITREYYNAKIKELESEIDEEGKNNLGYPRYSGEQFHRIPWRPNQMDLTRYVGRSWQCSDCGNINTLDPTSVSLEGEGMRLLLECSRCARHSIVKVKGILRPRLVTEASLTKEVNSELGGRVTSFPTCKLCGQETSRMGNLTNMVLVGINDPVCFNDKYGMMCAEHAGQLTEKILSEKGLSESELENAMAKATEIMGKDLK